jgi:hypothetical protein
MGRLDRRTRIVLGFLASLVAGYYLSRREDGSERVETNVLSNLAGAVGMVIGYRLGRTNSDP